MEIKERKLRHKEDLKQSILDAAKKLFLSEGYGATSIRKIAAEIEFSPTTIYLYYKDKAEIAHALHQEGFKELGARFAVLATVAGPLGATVVEAETDATYDLRPPPYLVLVYAAPFILVGILWGARMMRRRGAARGRPIDIHS